MARATIEVEELKREVYEVALSHVQVIFQKLDLLAFGLFKETRDGFLLDQRRRVESNHHFV